MPSDPGDRMQSDNRDVQELLLSHPIQIISLIDIAAVASLRSLYMSFSSENHISSRLLAHEREDYPWEYVIGSCAVAARLRHDDNMPNDPIDPELDDFVAGLIAAGVHPINGEQVAGIVSDYYQLVERHFPEFKAFKNSDLRT